MDMQDIILKKRDGYELSKEEIYYFVEGYTRNKIPDYQASALLMAIMFQGMSDEETQHLTFAMRDSGDVVNLGAIEGVKVDKHSTGGVGDKTTLIVAPLASACGVKVAKMSGRGLGFTGGTVDKMESIPGFKTSLKSEEFYEQVEKIGVSVIGQTAHVAPADKKLYALRDVTATVDNLSLITSSIMSKKLACGSDAIVLDVKCGKGAFMKTQKMAEKLGRMMCKIGNAAGKRTIAVITDMNQPLGNAVGNTLEVIEAIDTLKNKGPKDITELSIGIASIMVYIGGKAKSIEEAQRKVVEALETGKALEVFKKFIAAQGGNPEIVYDYKLFKQPLFRKDIIATRDGDVARVDALVIGNASQHAGAGRATKEESIDFSAGIYLGKKIGDPVKKGEILATIYSDDEEKLERAYKEAKKAFKLVNEDIPPRVLVREVIGL